MKRYLICAGDPKGCGPYIIAKAWKKLSPSRGSFKIVGDEPALKSAFDAVSLKYPSESIIGVGQSSSCGDEGVAQSAARTLEMAAALVKERKCDAIITAPVNKKRMNLVWPGFAGQTQWLGEALGGVPVMMFCGPDQNSKKFPKMILTTTHVPISMLSRMITKEKVLIAIDAAYDHLTKSGIANPKIAVLALNPHAGEEGLLGSEEKEIIEPAILAAKEKRICADGPWPADSFFEGKHLSYDAVVCMYHDEALIPAKMHFGLDAVNVTLGLPVIRTSPGHGTVEDDPKGADPRGMIAAVRVARSLVSSCF